MNNPVLMQFEKSKNKIITVKVTLFLGDGGKEDEYVQGILKSVDYENQTITVEQHFPFYNLINKDTTETLLREFKIGQFLVVGNLKV